MLLGVAVLLFGDALVANMLLRGLGGSDLRGDRADTFAGAVCGTISMLKRRAFMLTVHPGREGALMIEGVTHRNAPLYSPLITE